MTLYPVILAGGSGTRLWPLSREYYPKQFLDLTGPLSMIQETVLRLDGLKDVAAPIIVCNESHRFLVTEQMKDLDRSTPTIILEPSGRNTGPALTLAASHILSGVGKDEVNDPVILAMPADHVIGNVPAFQSIVHQGLALAQHGAIVTFGISPTSPTTAYGYIKKGKALDQTGNAFEMSGFTEKPDSCLAEKMVDSGAYAWNSGIFMMKASIWINTITLYRPDIATICESAYRKGKPDGEFFRPNASIFESCPKDSIDYAVMEKLLKSDHRDSQVETEAEPPMHPVQESLKPGCVLESRLEVQGRQPGSTSTSLVLRDVLDLTFYLSQGRALLYRGRLKYWPTYLDLGNAWSL